MPLYYSNVNDEKLYLIVNLNNISLRTELNYTSKIFMPKILTSLSSWITCQFFYVVTQVECKTLNLMESVQMKPTEYTFRLDLVYLF